MEKIKKGDVVELVSMRKRKFESFNWLLEEPSLKNVKIGDPFIVEGTSRERDVVWLELRGLKYSHPSSKFKKSRRKIR